MNKKNLVLKIISVIELLAFAIGYFVGLNEFLIEYPLSFSVFPFIFCLFLSVLFAAVGILVIKFYFRLNADKNITKSCLKICLFSSLLLIVSCFSCFLKLESVNLFIISSPLCIAIVLYTLIKSGSVIDKNES